MDSKINSIDTNNIKINWCYDCNRKLACSGKGRGSRRAEQQKSITRHYNSNLHQKNKKKTDRNVYNLLLGINKNLCDDIVWMINKKVVDNYRKIEEGGNIDDPCIDTWDNDNKVNFNWVPEEEKFKRPYVMNMYGLNCEEYEKDTSHTEINKRIKMKSSPEFYKLDKSYYDIHMIGTKYLRSMGLREMESYHNINMEWNEMSLINKTINKIIDMGTLLEKVMVKYYGLFIWKNPDTDKNTPEQDTELIDYLEQLIATINYEILGEKKNVEKRMLKKGERN